MNAEQIKERRQEYLSAVKTRGDQSWQRGGLWWGVWGGVIFFAPFEQHWSCLRIKMSGPVVIDRRLLGEQSVNPQEGPQ